MQFESNFAQSLPSDPLNLNQSRLVEGACYSIVSPSPAVAPKLVSYSKSLAQELGLSENWIESEEGVAVLAGNKLLPGMIPYAMCYGGHQFGNWAGQLGDGRAINLGEWPALDGRTWTWQLKGSGKTPYSRFGDGLAVLRSSLREYLCSEAMHFLRVPTTRALSLVTTGSLVTRDMFYDGNPRKEPGAVVCRVAPTFIRFGNFEILAARNDVALLKQLANFTIANYYPELDLNSSDIYEQWFREICIRTSKLVCDWMRVGFVHGVLNTDNMSILGLTIDYGPYGWIDSYDTNWTPNTTDAEGRRYAFGNQPQIGQWNVVQLANALYPLIGEVEPLQRGLDAFTESISQEYLSMQLSKLGLSSNRLPGERDELRACVEGLEKCFTLTEIDMTIFYRKLAQLPEAWSSQNELAASEHRKLAVDVLQDAFYRPSDLHEASILSFWNWLDEYRELLQREQVPYAERVASMNSQNPKYVLRNYMAQQAIKGAEQGDSSELEQLMKVLARPYDEQPEFESLYFVKRPEWARSSPGCSTLSCSS